MSLHPVHNTHQYAALFSQGKEEGFNWFFRQFYPALTLFAFRMIHDKPASEDIVSQAFVKTWQRHHLFASAGDIRAYLYQVVRNDALKWIQQRQRGEKAIQDLRYLWLPNQQKDHFHHLVEAETLRQLREVIDMLPAQCGNIFRLLYLEGKTVREVAETMQLSVSTVKTQKKRGLDFVRKRLGISPWIFILTLLCKYNTVALRVNLTRILEQDLPPI